MKVFRGCVANFDETKTFYFPFVCENEILKKILNLPSKKSIWKGDFPEKVLKGTIITSVEKNWIL